MKLNNPLAASSVRPYYIAPSAAKPLMLARLGERNLLFSEAKQAIYEIHDVTASAWRAFDDENGSGRACRDLLGSCLDSAATQDFTGARPTAPTFRATSPSDRISSFGNGRREGLERLSLLVADVPIDLYLSKSLRAEVEEIFGFLAAQSTAPKVVMRGRVRGGTVLFSHAPRDNWSCSRGEFMPLLKAEIVDAVLQHAHYEVAMHAAAIVREGKAVLLLGAPGAGKSTLSIALAQLGLEVVADDIVFLDRSALVSGMPMPLTIKSGSWPLLGIHSPTANRRRYRRPDGQELCYLPHDPRRARQHCEISAVFILDRRAGAAAHTEDLDQYAALSALIQEGSTPNERLTADGFEALINGLADARCYRLTYGDCHEAARLLCGMA